MPKKRLNATTTDLEFSPFGINSGNFEIHLQDLKIKDTWISKFEQLCVDLEILAKNIFN